MQRFGTSSLPTWKIGIALLSRNWEDAVNLILLPRISDNLKVSEARRSWALEKDVKKSLSLFPSWCIAEKAILSHLRIQPNDFSGALAKVK